MNMGLSRSKRIMAAACLFVGTAVTSGCFAASKTPPPRPNVLFIAIDDLNDWIGALDTHPQVKTPNIDRLAARGTLFVNAHTQAPICNPSRTSVLTGLRPTTTGIYGLAPRYREVDKTRDLVTLPQYFAAHGYRTLSTGKILHGRPTPEERETEFHEWGPDVDVKLPKNKLVKDPVHMGNHPWLDWGVFPQADDSVSSDYKTATWAEEQIRRVAEQPDGAPFFLAAGFFLAACSALHDAEVV